MSVERNKLESALAQQVPNDVLEKMLDEYQHIKQQFFLRKFQPSELNGARFAECVLRLLEYLDTGKYTPFGKSLNSETIVNRISNNTMLKEAIRSFIPRLTRVILDVRNKRDVAHVGGEVSPNYSDSLFVVQAVDWILTELIRHFYSCTMDEAQRIINSINEVRIPIVAEIDGFVRVQDTSLDARMKALVVLYYKRPSKIKDTDLARWIKYKNESRFKKIVLPELDADALVHYENGRCSLWPKGAKFVEEHVSMDLLA